MKKTNLKNPCGATLSEGATFRSIENDSSDNINNCHLNFNEPKKKKGFTCLVKHFRSNPLTAMLRSRLSRFSQTKFRNKVAHTSHTLRMQAHSKSKDFGSLCNSYGFTLAETLITLTILGIVAAITIPALINRQQEAANRTKVKKAMTMYEKALNNMIIENDLKTNNAIITFGAEGGVCANTTEYFKKVEGNGCRFKTADRIWWDISDIENPLIILNDKNKDKEVAELKTLAKDTSDITTYAMIGRLDETTNAGIVRINDNAFEQANGTADQKAYMTKLWNFMNGRAAGGSSANDSNSNNANVDPLDYSTPCPFDDIQCMWIRRSSYPVCEYTLAQCNQSTTPGVTVAMGGISICKNCRIGDGSTYQDYAFDGEGHQIGQIMNGSLRRFNADGDMVWTTCYTSSDFSTYASLTDEIDPNNCKTIRIDSLDLENNLHYGYQECPQNATKGEECNKNWLSVVNQTNESWFAWNCQQKSTREETIASCKTFNDYRSSLRWEKYDNGEYKFYNDPTTGINYEKYENGEYKSYSDSNTGISWSKYENGEYSSYRDSNTGVSWTKDRNGEYTSYSDSDVSWGSNEWEGDYCSAYSSSGASTCEGKGFECNDESYDDCPEGQYDYDAWKCLVPTVRRTYYYCYK